LFLDGWRMPNDGLFRDRAAILELSFGLVIFTVVAAGFLIHWLIPAMPLAVAFALAAIVSPTDPVAVSAITKRVPMPRRLLRILQGESLLNDATGLVCFRFAVAAAMTGGFSLATASLTFLWLAAGGLAIGVGLTLAVSALQHRLSRRFGEEGGTPVLLSLLMPFGAYLLAERLHASGILAAVAAGVTMSRVELSGHAHATTRVRRAAVWDTLHFALNGTMFVLLGEQLPTILRGAGAALAEAGDAVAWHLAGYALAISLGLALLRFAWVWTSLRLTLYKARVPGAPSAMPDLRLVLVATLAGARGAITLAGVMSLPLLLPDGSPFPARDLAVFLASAVILLSLVAASVGLPPLLKGVQLPEEPADRGQEDEARRLAAAAGLAAIERARDDPAHPAADFGIHARAVMRLITLYRHRLDEGDDADATADQRRRIGEVERALRLAGLAAERETVFGLARAARISDETSRKLVREIDLVDSRYR
jgi:CPA1 family monovalent cation:H+ antiporter